MAETKFATPAETPRLPWYGTIILLAGVIVVALAKPLMPNGIIEYALRLAGRPLSLEVGQGRSVTLIEERPLVTGCQVQDVRWSPDGTALVTACPRGIQAWTLDGNKIGTGATTPLSPLRRMEILDKPFRVAYFTRLPDLAPGDFLVAIWNVQSGVSELLPVHLSMRYNFVVDQDDVRFPSADVPESDQKIKIIAVEGDGATRILQIGWPAKSVTLLPGSHTLLLGGSDGVLSTADIVTGDLRELPRPYTTTFPGGGGASGSVEGLVLAPDAGSVAIFTHGTSVTPPPGRNSVDMVAAKAWARTLGTTIQIRSVADGRLLYRMPGEALDVVDLAWDPHDRFIAAAGGDGLFLWHRQSGGTAVRAYSDAGIRHSLSITNDGTRLALTTANSVRIFRIAGSGESPVTGSPRNSGER